MSVQLHGLTPAMLADLAETLGLHGLSATQLLGLLTVGLASK